MSFWCRGALQNVFPLPQPAFHTGASSGRGLMEKTRRGQIWRERNTAAVRKRREKVWESVADSLTEISFYLPPRHINIIITIIKSRLHVFSLFFFSLTNWHSCTFPREGASDMFEIKHKMSCRPVGALLYLLSCVIVVGGWVPHGVTVLFSQGQCADQNEWANLPPPHLCSQLHPSPAAWARRSEAELTCAVIFCLLN